MRIPSWLSSHGWNILVFSDEGRVVPGKLAAETCARCHFGLRAWLHAFPQQVWSSHGWAAGHAAALGKFPFAEPGGGREKAGSNETAWSEHAKIQDPTLPKLLTPRCIRLPTRLNGILACLNFSTFLLSFTSNLAAMGTARTPLAKDCFRSCHTLQPPLCAFKGTLCSENGCLAQLILKHGLHIQQVGLPLHRARASPAASSFQPIQPSASTLILERSS